MSVSFPTLPTKDRYLIGVSGGRDSVALLHWLHQSGCRKLTLCHLNHQLRGKDSTADARFVQNLAQKLQLPCIVKKSNVSAFATEHQLSIEAAARELRYAFFADCARQLRCPRIILAHHANDQAETVLYNFLRGSAGAKGMQATSQRRIHGYSLTLLRPWLDVTRSQINEFITTQKIKFREDATNAQPVATRNRLRNEALPLLSEILSRDLTPILARAAAHQREVDDILAAMIEHLQLLDPQGRLFLPKLLQLPPILQRQALLAYLKSHGVPQLDRATLDRARDLLIPGGPHQLSLPGKLLLKRKEGRIFIKPSPEGLK